MFNQRDFLEVANTLDVACNYNWTENMAPDKANKPIIEVSKYDNESTNKQSNK